jgi:hypothetical protein
VVDVEIVKAITVVDDKTAGDGVYMKEVVK